MKANELMIGDWVDFYHPYEPEKKIVTRHRVTEVFECGLVGISNHPNPVHADHIEPVKITPDILEKNGWVRTKYAYGRDCMEIHGADELPEGVDNALSMARWSIDKNYQYHFLDLYMWKGSVMQHNVHYVHQLQHAFRIFGIEKTIEL